MSGARAWFVSPQTVVVSVLIAAGIVATAVGVAMAGDNEALALAVVDIGDIVVLVAAACVVLLTAIGFRRGEPMRAYWLLIGIGAASYAAGDIAWSIYELGGLEVPYPGLPDVFYLLEYPLLAAGLVYAANGYRGLVDQKTPGIVAGSIAAVAAAAVYVGFLHPYVVVPEEVPLAEKVLSSAYPLFDIAFGLLPALFISLVVVKLGAGRLAWPWRAVAVGVAMIAVSDTAYAWLSAIDSYASGSVIDYGWMGGHAMMALGAMLMRDASRVG